MSEASTPRPRRIEHEKRGGEREPFIDAMGDDRKISCCAECGERAARERDDIQKESWCGAVITSCLVVITEAAHSTHLYGQILARVPLRECADRRALGNLRTLAGEDDAVAVNSDGCGLAVHGDLLDSALTWQSKNGAEFGTSNPV
jgi:hypothetical protein